MNRFAHQLLVVASGFLLLIVSLFVFSMLGVGPVRAQATRPADAKKATEVVGTLRIVDNEPAGANGYLLTFDAIEPPPTGSHYELWLTSEQTETVALGVITVTNGTVDLQGQNPRNLLIYNQALISLEPDQKSGSAITGPIVFSSTLPPEFTAHLQPLLWQTAAGEKGAIHGVYEQVQIAVKHTGFLRKALTDFDMPQAQRHTEHIINILDGKEGFLYNDYDRDGQAQNPGDGVGVRVYLEAALPGIAELAAFFTSAHRHTDQSAMDEATKALEAGQGIVEIAFDKAPQIFSADTVTEAQKFAGELTVIIDELNTQAQTAYTKTIQYVEYRFLGARPPEAQNDKRTLVPTRTAVAQTATPIPTIAPMQTITKPRSIARAINPVQAKSWQNPVDGAIYIYIEGGEFTMGSTKSAAASPREQPQHPVQVESFWLQQTETTNAQYVRCVEAGACTPPANERWQDPDFADHPVTDVDWQQANAYSQWAGGRLPTEAEWERACRGDDGRTYPWGENAPTAEVANFNNNNGDTLPAGSLTAGASPYGALDMSGNVWEWTSSLDVNYPYNASDGREDATATGKRIVRGGSYYYTQYQIRCAARTGFAPDSIQPQFGFRVVNTEKR